MVKTATQIQDIDTSLEFSTSSFTYLPKITAPYTQITKRAQVTDFAADGLPKFGVERIMTQQLIEVQGEVGPAGERVWKALNDIHDQVRFVGGFLSLNDNIGQYIQAPSADSSSFIEITFYGTALNALVAFNTTANRSVNISVDGGGTTSVAFTGTTGSPVLNNRNYSVNMVWNLVSNLSLGMHTVKILGNGSSSQLFSGFEILNTASSIFLPTAQSFIGGKRAYKPSTSTTAYNSGFESGTLGTRGGHVLVYQKADGTIAKAVTPTNASAAYLTSADHTNEEEIRRYHWREFGAGRTDDFSSLTGSTASKAFTLDDGTTTLICANGFVPGSVPEGLAVNANGDFWTITFVGTGLDIVRQDSANGGSDTFSATIDGTSVGNFSTTGSTTKRIEKVVSGLPYGTHTVKMTRVSVATFSLCLHQFIVYSPKTPTLPTGAVALSDYFVMADYTANATAGDLTVGTGTLRKQNVREIVYVNGTGGTTDWTIPAVQINNCISGFTSYTDRLNAYVEYVFFGVGFEFRFLAASNRSSNVQLSLQSLSTGGSLLDLNTTNFPAITGNNSAYGTGVVFNQASGVLDMLDAASTEGGVSIRGLTLGYYKIRVQNKTASAFMICDAFDIITPVHCHREIGPARLQNTSLIGSCALGDLRNFAASQVPESKAWSQAVGINVSPTTTSTTMIPAPDLSVTIKTTGNPIQIIYSTRLRADAASRSIQQAIYINGVASVAPQKALDTWTGGGDHMMSDSVTVPVSAGIHKVDVYWLVSAGTATQTSTSRNLTVREIN